MTTFCFQSPRLVEGQHNNIFPVRGGTEKDNLARTLSQSVWGARPLRWDWQTGRPCCMQEPMTAQRLFLGLSRGAKMQPNVLIFIAGWLNKPA
jgi:hypothetical protein